MKEVVLQWSRRQLSSADDSWLSSADDSWLARPAWARAGHGPPGPAIAVKHQRELNLVEKIKGSRTLATSSTKKKKKNLPTYLLTTYLPTYLPTWRRYSNNPNNPHIYLITLRRTICGRRRTLTPMSNAHLPPTVRAMPLSVWAPLFSVPT